MNYKAGVALAALALSISGTAYAVPDSCDDGGQFLSGTIKARTDAVYSLTGVLDSDYLGRAVAVGDFNGDGLDDVAIGANGDDTNGAVSGAVYVVYGGIAIPQPSSPVAQAPVDGFASTKVIGEAYGDRTGWSLAVADIDSDGFDDLIVGSNAAAGASGGAGIVHVVLGSQLASASEVDLATQAFARIVGESKGDGFGLSVANLGDINNDGFDDIGVGAPTFSSTLVNRGALYVFSGDSLGGDMLAATTVNALIAGNRAEQRLGTAMSSAGDYNGDGFNDFAVGAPLDASVSTRNGAVFVFTGAPGPISSVWTPATAFQTMVGRQYFRCGASLASGGDLDGDGKDDLVVGCPFAGSGKPGAVYITPGSASGGTGAVPDVRIAEFWGAGFSATAGSGVKVADFNGDGRNDLLIGGSRAFGEVFGSGVAWITYGPFVTGTVHNLGTGRDAAIQGTAYQDFFAGSLAVGDLDGDGFADPVLGAWRFSPTGGYQRGEVAMWFGGSDSADLVTYYKDEDNDGFGATAASTQGCSNSPPTTGGFSWVRKLGDCRDTDAQYYPGALEFCTDPDLNCDGSQGATDQDVDGFIACKNGTDLYDCNDGNQNINPSKPEACNQVDDDCDGLIDAEDPSVVDARTWYVDNDGDGYGPTSSLTRVCGTSADFANAVALGGDCDDTATGLNVNPGKPELCNDGINNDCANGIDDAYAIDVHVYWRDADNDGAGDPAQRVASCSRPLGYAENRSDCDDTRSTTVPGAVETCDYADNDCSGMNYLGGLDNSANRALVDFLGAAAGDQLKAGGFLADQDADGDSELILASEWNAGVARAGGVVYLKYGGIAGGDYGKNGVKLGVSADGHYDLGAVRADGSGWYDVKFYATRKDSRFGASVATGDFNGDGTEDIAIGAPGARVPNISQGAVYVFFGPIRPGSYKAEDANVILKGVTGYTSTGAKIVSGDVDDDGYDDLLVSAPDFTSTFSKQGRVYMVYGSAALAGQIRVDQVANVKTFTGPAAKNLLGNAMQIGDLDGDGYRDVVLAAENYGGTFLPGAVWVFYGSGSRPAGATLTPSATINGDAGELLGHSLAVSDMNHDGKDDIVFGTSRNYVYTRFGSATRLSGVTTASAIHNMRLDLPIGGSREVVPLGDLNQDSYADVAVVNTDDDQGPANDYGAFYIIYGRADFALIVPNHTAFGLDRMESFGRIDPTGRTLQDGKPVVLSATSLNVLEGAKIKGLNPADYFGQVSSSGDFDGDGFNDLAVAATGFDRSGLESQNGKVYVILAGPYGTDVFVTDGSQETLYWDYDADLWTTSQTFVSCRMHRPISFRNPAVPVPRGWAQPTAKLDCNDYNENIHPEATETAGQDGVDSDCDGYDIPNVLPLLTLQLNPANPLATDTLSAQVTITDTDPIVTPISLQYEWYRDGVLIPNQNSSTLLPTNFAKGSLIKVRVRADDTRGLTAWKEAQVTISNSKPTLASCAVTPTTVGVGTPMAVTAAGLTDDDAADVPFLTTDYQWQIEQFPAWANIPGQTNTTIPSCTSRNVAETNPNAIYNCQRGARMRATCTPRDPSSTGTPVVSNVITIANTRPSVTVCAVNPATATTTTDLTAVAVAEDPDVEPVTISYEWFVNSVSTGSVGTTLSNTVTSHFDQVQLKCTPRDSYGEYGPTITSSPVTILNTPPTGVSIDLLPNFPRSNQDLYVNITQASTDIDGDAITYLYYWQRNGSNFGNPTYPSQVSTVQEASTTKGDTWSVTVVASDGFSTGASANDSVLILNTAPTVQSATVSPAAPTSDSTVSAVAVGFFDHDGDAQANKFQWWIDGVAVDGALGGTQQTLPAARGRRGKIAFVVLTADDGDPLQDGNTVTSGYVTYVNTPPYAPVINDLSPNQPGESDDLLCTYATASSDWDNDSISYTVEWWRFRPTDAFNAPNGAGTYTRVHQYTGVNSTTGAAYTLSASETSYADRYYCKVTPNDGFADGPSAQSAEKAINDNDAPAQPTINAIETYRNNTSVTLSGTCLSFPNDCYDLHVQCTDDLGATIEQVSPNPATTPYCTSGGFSRTISVSRGRSYSCTAWCFDIGGNRSLNASSRTTNVCSGTQYDQWEVNGTNAPAHGNSMADKITGTLNADGTTMASWATLADTNTASVTIIGNILGAGVEYPADVYDWYYIRSSDSYTSDVSATKNSYNFEIEMDQGVADYQIQVHRDTGAPTPTQMCPLAGTYDHFNFYNYDQLDYTHPHHTVPADRQSCDGDLIGAFNKCTDYTSNYYVRVNRETAQSCQNYRLQFRNGDPTWQ